MLALAVVLVSLLLGDAALTSQEVSDCAAQAELFEAETAGGVLLEALLFVYAILVMYLLIEEWYVPALEIVTSIDVIDAPRPLLGSTVMAAGNCLPELSISLAAILFSGTGGDIGTGEIFGSCVFDLLVIFGVVCIRMPEGGTQVAAPLMLYFVAWSAIATATDVGLFFSTVETTWPTSIGMLACYVAFVLGMFSLHALYPSFAVAREFDAPPPSPLPALDYAGRTHALPTGRPLGLPVNVRRKENTPLLPTPALPGWAANHPALMPGAGDARSSPLFSATSAKRPSGTSVRSSGKASAESGLWHWRVVDRLVAPPRLLFGWTVPVADVPMPLLRDRRPWVFTLIACIGYMLLLSYLMVLIATRVGAPLLVPCLHLWPWTLCGSWLDPTSCPRLPQAICLLGIRKNTLGATVLCLSAGLPDLLTAVVLVGKPGMHQMAASNPFGALVFNAFVALGLPWAVLGLYTDVFPPARGTWFSSLVGFACILIGLFALVAGQLRLSHRLGIGLLCLYVVYLILVVYDGTLRAARPPA